MAFTVPLALVIDFAISYSLCSKFSSSHCREQMSFTFIGLITCNNKYCRVFCFEQPNNCGIHLNRSDYILSDAILRFAKHVYILVGIIFLPFSTSSTVCSSARSTFRFTSRFISPSVTRITSL